MNTYLLLDELMVNTAKGRTWLRDAIHQLGETTMKASSVRGWQLRYNSGRPAVMIERHIERIPGDFRGCVHGVILEETIRVDGHGGPQLKVGFYRDSRANGVVESYTSERGVIFRIRIEGKSLAAANKLYRNLPGSAWHRECDNPVSRLQAPPVEPTTEEPADELPET